MNYIRFTSITRKCLQSKRATASLLIQKQFMQKKVEFVVVFISPAKRHCMGVCAVENSMLFILDIIISLTQITGRGGAGVPCRGLKAKGVDMQS